MIPNPGSPEAIARGCTCCAEANRHGKGLRFATGAGRNTSFWPDYLCKLHGRNTDWGGKVGRRAAAPRAVEPQRLDAWGQR